ncbi:hypothetical protein LZ554_007577 [Drepanopeziza brunnea f. sp. 'monogermtubi']|nr:hypothetical protein LZ554_007577 [Drepanopeziza brunnea f. sp. 'monogermtubi']
MVASPSPTSTARNISRRNGWLNDIIIIDRQISRTRFHRKYSVRSFVDSESDRVATFPPSKDASITPSESKTFCVFVSE